MHVRSLITTFLITLAAIIHTSVPATAQVSAAQRTGMVDSIHFGTSSSERLHQFTDRFEGSKLATGAQLLPARVLLPPVGTSWHGGAVSFTLGVNPRERNYVTVKLWGGEASSDRLILYCNGKQVGYMHLGDVDILDANTLNMQAPCPGRFYFETTPLPFALTQNHHAVRLQIRATGEVWDYGANFAQFQKPMRVASRAIYAAYTDTNAYFSPNHALVASLPQHKPIAQLPSTSSILRQVEDRVNREIAGELHQKHALNQMQLQFLARSYHVPYTTAFHNPAVVNIIIHGIDALYQGWLKSPPLMQSDPSTPNPGWFTFGPAANAVWQVYAQVTPALTERIDGPGGTMVPRRLAWAAMFRDSVNWSREHRRQYTNQSMIVDLNTLLANRTVALLDPAMALPTKQVLAYAYQSLGLIPWLGSDTAHGPAMPLGKHYFELTRMHLTKELGYVGYYGEVLDWATQIYNATRTSIHGAGDPRVKKALVQIAQARAFFRYPDRLSIHRFVMRLEGVIGWRDEDHFPGDVTYAERVTWDGSALFTPAATSDPKLVGYAQQMFREHEFVPEVVTQLNQNNSLRVTAGLLDLPLQYSILMKQPVSRYRLPMSSSVKNLVWADPEDGVVAVKHNDTILYASLYWRARNAVNFLARIHQITPVCDRIAVVHETERFVPSGMTFTRPDDIIGVASSGVKYPGHVHLAEAGAILPIAQIPTSEKFRSGDESPYAGRALLYILKYGRYLIAMNAAHRQRFTVPIPQSAHGYLNLNTSNALNAAVTHLTILPMQTIVLLKQR